MDRLSRFLNRCIERSLFGLGFVMALVVAVQVFFRYGLNHSLFWSEELARFLLVWLTFLGASVAYRRKAHPGINLFTTRLPPDVQKGLLLVVHLTSLAFFSVMTYYGAHFAYFVRLQISPALSLPKWIVFSIIPLSGLVLTIHGICFLLQDLKRSRHDG